MIRCRTAGLAIVLVATAAVWADEPKKKDDWKPLFDGKTLAGWKAAEYTGAAQVHVQDGAIVIDRGAPMTGVAYTRGLNSQGTWDAGSGVYRDTGGYIAYLGGSVVGGCGGLHRRGGKEEQADEG